VLDSLEKDLLIDVAKTIGTNTHLILSVQRVYIGEIKRSIKLTRTVLALVV